MLRYARTSLLLRHRHSSGRDDIYNYDDLSWRYLILEAEQDAEASIRHHFNGYIRALISLVLRQELENTHILHQQNRYEYLYVGGVLHFQGSASLKINCLTAPQGSVCIFLLSALQKLCDNCFDLN